MAFSLFDATIPNFLQGIGAVRGLVGKAQAYCAETGTAPEEIIGARLIDDMLPVAYQVKSVAVHSQGAIEGVRKGQFSPDMSEPPASYAARIERLDAAKAALDLQVPTYHFLKRYLARRPPVPLTLTQINPLIRQLTLYRDLIDQQTGDPE